MVIVALIFRPASSLQFNANSSSICIANVILIVMFINPILILNYIIFVVKNHIDWEKYNIEIQKRNAQIHLAPSSLLPFLVFPFTPLNLKSSFSKFLFWHYPLLQRITRFIRQILNSSFAPATYWLEIKRESLLLWRQLAPGFSLDYL